MSSLRITQNSMNRTQMDGLNSSLSRLQQTQEQLTTGKRLNRPSDDPVATVSALRFRADQSQIDQLGENIKDGMDRLRAADDALTQSSSIMQRIRTLAVASATGTLGPGEREANADEIAELRHSLIQQANTQFGGQPIFGGTTPGSQAFDPVSGAFVGNTLPVLRAVTNAPGAAGQMNVAVNGVEAFGKSLEADGEIDRLIKAIRAGDSAGMSQGLTDMENVRQNLVNAATTAGVRTNRLSGLETVNGKTSDSIAGSLSKVEDTDFLKAAMDLSIQSNAYQAALSASAKIIQPSLMDFLR